MLLEWPIKARLQRYPLVLFEQLLKPNYFVIPSTDAAPQFPLKLTPFTVLKFSSLIVIAEYYMLGAVGSYNLHGGVAKNECNCFGIRVTGL